MPQLPDSVVIGFALEVDGVEKIARFSNPAMRHAVLFAPDMLAALESVEAVLDSIVMDEALKEAGLLQGPMVTRTRALVLDVISKARGEDA